MKRELPDSLYFCLTKILIYVTRDTELVRSKKQRISCNCNSKIGIATRSFRKLISNIGSDVDSFRPRPLPEQ